MSESGCSVVRESVHTFRLGDIRGGCDIAGGIVEDISGHLKSRKDLLHVHGWESNGLPEVTAIFAGYAIVLVPFLLNHRVVLDRKGVPHHLVPPLSVFLHTGTRD